MTKRIRIALQKKGRLAQLPPKHPPARAVAERHRVAAFVAVHPFQMAGNRHVGGHERAGRIGFGRQP